jgi:hypothetical protein
MAKEAVGNLWPNDGLLKSLKHIGPEILGILYAAAYPDKIVKDAYSFSLILWNASVCHAARNLY